MPTNIQVEYSPTESTTCPYCHSQIAQQGRAMRCAECNSVYHESCWAEINKCAQFGCECTVAHAVIHRPILGDGSQSRWQLLRNKVAIVESVPNIQRPTHLVSLPRMEEYGSMWKNLVYAPRKVWPTRKKIQKAREYYKKKGQRTHFDEMLLSMSAIVTMMIGLLFAITYKELQMGSISPPLLLAWVIFLPMAVWLFLIIFILIDRVRVQE